MSVVLGGSIKGKGGIGSSEWAKFGPSLMVIGLRRGSCSVNRTMKPSFLQIRGWPRGGFLPARTNFAQDNPSHPLNYPFVTYTLYNRVLLVKLTDLVHNKTSTRKNSDEKVKLNENV